MEQPKIIFKEEQGVPPCPYKDGDISVEYISVDKAREYFANQRGNRPLKRQNLDKMINDLLNGRFVEKNGRTICFDKHGKLGDGQHFCKMIMEAGSGLWCICVRNLPDEAFNVIDTGSVKSPGDIFKFNGVADSIKKAALIRTYLRLRAGSNVKGLKAANVSAANLLDLYNCDEESFDNSLKIGGSCYKKKPFLAGSFIGAMVYYLIRDKHHPQEVVEDFFHQVFWQENVSMEVVKLLHDALLNDCIRSKENRRASMASTYKTMIIVKAWNAFVTKKDLKRLNWNEKQEKPFWFV